MKTYLVGGAVRDRLLGKEPLECDWVVVGGTPETLLAQGYQPVGRDFPVFLHPETKEEYALARTERKSGHGYRGFHFVTSPDISLEDDLRRRDLTINAMAMDADGTLIDPYGGCSDLETRLLRHVSPAFGEDPVRLLRVARFAAVLASKGFQVADETLELMREMVAEGEVDHLIPERVWAETHKALLSRHPERYFEILRDCNALRVIFPELDNLFGVPQPVQHHPEIDTGLHTLMALQAAVKLSPEPRVRFAVLVHDLGKGITPREYWPRHHGHEENGVRLIEQMCNRLRVPNDYRKLGKLVCRYHGHYRRVICDLRADTIVRILQVLDVFRRPKRFEEFLLACEADLRGREGFKDVAVKQSDVFRKIADICTRLSAQEVMSEDMNGKAIAKALERRRVQSVESELQVLRRELC